MILTFFVPGTPAPGGSKRFVGRSKKGKPIIIDDCKRNKSWREQVVSVAHEAATKSGETFPWTGPLQVTFDFYMPRPKYHYGTGRNEGKLKKGVPQYHIQKPDKTKLIRSTEDAISDAGLWGDDTQNAVDGGSAKMYVWPGQMPGCQVTIKTLDDNHPHPSRDASGA